MKGWTPCDKYIEWISIKIGDSINTDPHKTEKVGGITQRKKEGMTAGKKENLRVMIDILSLWILWKSDIESNLQKLSNKRYKSRIMKVGVCSIDTIHL
jgi:hypothetical protein